MAKDAKKEARRQLKEENAKVAFSFDFTGRLDPEEGSQLLRQAGVSITLALDALGSSLPDEPQVHDQLARSAGLVDGRAFRFVRNVLVEQGVLQKGKTPNGVVLMLTDKGREMASKFRAALQEQGALDKTAEEEIKEIHGRYYDGLENEAEENTEETT